MTDPYVAMGERFAAVAAAADRAAIAGAPGVADAMVRFARKAADSRVRILDFVHAIDLVTWAARRRDYELHGRTRPDGRPRRSGHRHRGTTAWARRHG